MSNYCSECGFELNDEELFCPECGTKIIIKEKLKKENVTQSPSENLEKGPTFQQHTKSKNSDLKTSKKTLKINTNFFFKIRLSGIILLLIILIGLYYFFFMNDFTKSKPNIPQYSNEGQVVAQKILNSSNLIIENLNSVDLVLNNTNKSNEYIVSNRFDKKSEFVLTANAYNKISIYSISTKKSMQIIGFNDWVTSASYSPNNQYLLVSTKKGKLNLIDINNWESIREIFTTGIDFQSICFDPTGNFLGVPQNFGAEIVKLNNNLTTVFKVPTRDKVTQVTFSNSGNLFAVASYDRTIKICSMKDGSIIHDFIAHQYGVNSIVFSKDDKYLISASIDKTIKIWNVSSGQLIKSWRAHRSDVNVIVISPDGKLIVSGGYDNIIKIWSFPEGRLIRELTGHYKGIRTLSFSPDSEYLYSEGWDGISLLWDIKNDVSYQLK